MKEYLYQKNELEGVISIITEIKINRMVYELYGLTEEEIAIVEESVV